MSKRLPDMSINCVEENGEPAIYIECDGVRIAKRGHPDSPQARTWVSLEPGWVVRDNECGDGIEIECHDVVVQ